MGEEKDLSPFLEAFGTEIKIDALLEHIGGKDFYNEYLEEQKRAKEYVEEHERRDAAINELEEADRRHNRQVNETYGIHHQDAPMTAEQMDDVLGSINDTLSDALSETLGAFAARSPNVRIHRPWANRNERMYVDEIARLAEQFDDLKDLKETKTNPFVGTFHLDKRQKQEYLKSVFVNLISSKINFDDDMNIVDQDGQPIKSIGQFGLFFMRLLNETLEKKRSAEENEADLKKMFK